MAVDNPKDPVYPCLYTNKTFGERSHYGQKNTGDRSSHKEILRVLAGTGEFFSGSRE